MRIFLSLFTFLISSHFILSEGIFDSVKIDVLCLTIAGISSIAIFSCPSRPYSLFKVFFIFVLFFFCVAPAIQYKSGVSLLFTKFSEDDYVITLLHILLSILLYLLFYVLFYTQISLANVGGGKEDVFEPIKIKKEIFFVIIAFCIFLYYFYINNFNLLSLLFRGGEFAERISVSQIVFLISSYFLRPITMMLFLATSIAKTTHKITPIMLFLLFVLSAPPTGMARFAAAAMYIPVAMRYIPFLRKKNVFVLVLILSLLIVFPFLGSFRNYAIDQGVVLGLDIEQFKTLNFDSFSMFMRVLKDDVITHGNQLLGVLFFWIPRSFWSAKPIGSGAFIAEKNNLVFSNISMPFIGEGYINFGLLGMILFVILLAYFTAKIDKHYWSYIVYVNKNIEQIRYFILLGLLVFILRGDMLSSLAYTFGFMFAFGMVKRMVK